MCLCSYRCCVLLNILSIGLLILDKACLWLNVGFLIQDEVCVWLNVGLLIQDVVCVGLLILDEACLWLNVTLLILGEVCVWLSVGLLIQDEVCVWLIKCRFVDPRWGETYYTGTVPYSWPRLWPRNRSPTYLASMLSSLSLQETTWPLCLTTRRVWLVRRKTENMTRFVLQELPGCPSGWATSEGQNFVYDK